MKLKLNNGSIEVKNQTDTAADLYFYGDIVSDSWQSYWYDEDKCPQDVADLLNSIEKNAALNIYINSGGGDAFGGIAIYNLLKRHSGQKTVHVDALAASVASVIAMAGDRIIIPRTAQLMVHKPWGYQVGNADEMRKAADALDACQESIMAVYMENAAEGVDRETIEALVNAETWLTGERAAQYFNIEVEEGVNVAACCGSAYFNRYKNMPETLAQDEAPERKTEDSEKPERELIIPIDQMAEAILAAMEKKERAKQEQKRADFEARKKAILEDLV